MPKPIIIQPPSALPHEGELSTTSTIALQSGSQCKNNQHNENNKRAREEPRREELTERTDLEDIDQPPQRKSQ